MSTQIIAILMTIILSFSNNEPTTYAKEFHANGALKAEGWLMGSQKIKYWKFYDTQGELLSEGHYKNNERDGYWYFYNMDGHVSKEGHYHQGIAQNWWIFYDLARQEKIKVQYVNNQKNGFCLIYKNKKLTKAEKYENNLLIGSWTSIRDFRRDNPEVSLLSL